MKKSKQNVKLEIFDQRLTMGKFFFYKKASTVPTTKSLRFTIFWEIFEIF